MSEQFVPDRMQTSEQRSCLHDHPNRLPAGTEEGNEPAPAAASRIWSVVPSGRPTAAPSGSPCRLHSPPVRPTAARNRLCRRTQQMQRACGVARVMAGAEELSTRNHKRHACVGTVGAVGINILGEIPRRRAPSRSASIRMRLVAKGERWVGRNNEITKACIKPFRFRLSHAMMEAPAFSSISADGTNLQVV